MPKIIQLSPHIANLIAAGEVVERPASVVKELLENAVDAGASKVTVEIRDGGMTFLRVTDNGCGMSREQAAALSTDAPPPENGHSIGVRNTVQRLALQYEGRYQFYILSSPGHYTQINIVYPLEQKGGPS